MEIWKDIKGYEGRYQVSNEGKVRSLDRITEDKNGIIYNYKGRVLKCGSNHKGYLHIGLSKDGKHINENKKDNRVENLEWITNKDNLNYGSAQERRLISRRLNS